MFLIMHNNPYFNVFLDHIMNLYKMIEILLKYDNMQIIGVINALNCIYNHIITCINSMLSFPGSARVVLPLGAPPCT